MACFGQRLADSVRLKNSAVCVGLDPRWQSLPESITSGISVSDRAAVAQATTRYCTEILDAVADVVPVVKPQAAFFEILGPEGMQCLSEVVRHARKLGLLVLMDAKRGDIGSTAEGYAAAYLGEESPWQCDALTVNPYLGDDTLEPFAAEAGRTDSGLFVLVKTSNPGSGFLQDMEVAGGKVYEKVADCVQNMNKVGELPVAGYGSIGAVVGATYPDQLSELRERMPNAWLLIPGYGAQGGTAADVARGFDANGLGAVVNSSRGIIFAYQKQPGVPWQDAVRSAAEDMAAQLRAAK